MTEIKPGSHFWAKMNGKLVMMCRTNDYVTSTGKKYPEYYVCGWSEDGFDEDDFEFIEDVKFPEGFGVGDLYYK